MSKNNRARRRKKQLALKRRGIRLPEQGTVYREPHVLVGRLSVDDIDDSEELDRVLVAVEWDISDEPVRTNRPSSVNDLASQGYQCLLNGKFSEAEAFFRQALDVCPDGPDLWNNLATALFELDKQNEALEITSMLRSRFPDYFFGIIRDATEAIDRGDLDRAGELLQGLHVRKKLHTTEFRALVTAHITLADASEEFAEAKAWLRIWKDYEDHPLQSEIAQRLDFRDIFSQRSIKKFMRRLSSD